MTTPLPSLSPPLLPPQHAVVSVSAAVPVFSPFYDLTCTICDDYAAMTSMTIAADLLFSAACLDPVSVERDLRRCNVRALHAIAAFCACRNEAAACIVATFMHRELRCVSRAVSDAFDWLALPKTQTSLLGLWKTFGERALLAPFVAAWEKYTVQIIQLGGLPRPCFEYKHAAQVHCFKHHLPIAIRRVLALSPHTVT